MTYQVKNWSALQSYKDRSPTWIRLHRSLLDDYEFVTLPVHARAVLPMLWLLAAEHTDPTSGLIEGGDNKIAFRLRMPVQDLRDALTPLIQSGFLVALQPCNEVVTEIYKSVTPETESDTDSDSERKKEKNIKKESSPPNALGENQTKTAEPKVLSATKRKPNLTDLPENWRPNDSHIAKCQLLNLEPNSLAEQFVNNHLSKGNRFADWDRAFFTWIGNAKNFNQNKHFNGGGYKPAAPSVAEVGLRVAARYSQQM